MKLRWKKGTAGEQRGAFIVFTALTLWFLMMFVAFSVDFGNYYQHRSRLQNAADAAALAGVAKYTEEEIAANSAGAVSTPTLSQGRLVTLVENDKAVSASQTVRDQAQNYVTNNYGNIDIKYNKVWSEEATEETIENGVTTSVKTTHRYCRVDLEDTIQTFFARIFGVDSLTVKVSALAMMDGAESTTVEEMLLTVSGNLNAIIPDYYWESIAKYKSNIYDKSSKEKVGTTAAPDPNDPSKSSNEIYGKENRNYLVSDTNFDYTEVRWGARTDEDGNLIFGYTDVDHDGNSITDGICAKPIYGKGDTGDNILTQVFRFESPESVLYGGQEIKGLFLDRDNITSKVTIDGKSKWAGAADRFVDIYVGKLASNEKATINPLVPIFTRLESEPIQLSETKRTVNGQTFVGGGLTTVCGITIHVTLPSTANLAEIKPFVFAYDGPDPNRGRYDAPWIASRATQNGEAQDWIKNNNGKDAGKYSSGQIREDLEPLLRAVDRSVIPEYITQSSLTTPGPIVVDIPSNCVFKGVIWAPRSQVTITGGGRIVGFIAARRIIDASPADHTFVQSQRISMPTLAAYHPEGKKYDYFDYERFYIEDYYNMVYSEFVDWTATSDKPNT